jgi:hypothetical protein
MNVYEIFCPHLIQTVFIARLQHIPFEAEARLNAI